MVQAPNAATGVHDLKALVSSYNPLIVIESVEEARVAGILRAVGLKLKMPFHQWSITHGLKNTATLEGTADTESPPDLLKHMEGCNEASIFQLMDFATHLGDPKTARSFRELAQKFSRTRSTIVLTGPVVKLPVEVEHMAVRYDLALPSREELRALLVSTLQSLPAVPRITVDMESRDMDAFLKALTGLTLNQARQVIALAILEDGILSAKDVNTVLERKAQVIRDAGILEYFPLGSNQYEIGGFEKLKAWLKRAALGYSEEARKLNLSAPKGILILGVQGCGKSLAAKAIAREWSLPLLKLDAGRLFDKYIGESERNFRKAITLAETMAPVVLWIDEIEKGLSPQGSEADGGLSRRLFGAFLTWLQEKRKEVFVVATANDLSALPPELLRKGRFDEIFFVDLPDAEERRSIFSIHLGLRRQEVGRFSLDELARASEGFSGAELEQAVIGALYRALELKQALDDGLLLAEIRVLIPLSVSRREDLARLREAARGRFTPVR